MTDKLSDAPASSSDRIVKQITLDAPRSRVWRALTDVSQFNEWFGATLEGTFTPGAETTGRIAVPEYSHLAMRLWIETMEPERHFAFRWHPYAIDESVDYSAEPMTLVSFTLDEVEGGAGTRLTIVESGFDAIPAARRAAAFTSNSSGWAIQAENIRKFVGN